MMVGHKKGIFFEFLGEKNSIDRNYEERKHTPLEFGWPYRSYFPKTFSFLVCHLRPESRKSERPSVDCLLNKWSAYPKKELPLPKKNGHLVIPIVDLLL